MKLHDGNSTTEFACYVCMERRLREQGGGFICQYRKDDQYCPAMEHIFLHENSDECMSNMIEAVRQRIKMRKKLKEHNTDLLKRSAPVHTMKVDKQHYDNIFSGTKTVEMRLYDIKRQGIAVGDLISFACDSYPEENIVVTVVETKVFLDFKELVEHYTPIELGFEGEDRSYICGFMNGLYGMEKVNANKVVAIRINKG